MTERDGLCRRMGPSRLLGKGETAIGLHTCICRQAFLFFPLMLSVLFIFPPFFPYSPNTLYFAVLPILYKVLASDLLGP